MIMIAQSTSKLWGSEIELCALENLVFKCIAEKARIGDREVARGVVESYTETQRPQASEKDRATLCACVRACVRACAYVCDRETERQRYKQRECERPR